MNCILGNIFCAATLKQKLLIELAIFPSHNIYLQQAPSRAATRIANISVTRMIGSRRNLKQSLEFVMESRILAEMKIENRRIKIFSVGKKIGKHTFYL